ncbi:MAG TPA: hypothetical protein VL992_07630 [Tepidisphaeraceae bacterium]|nr:hypothetical protein [Tepidisphaeraceae bacterium]
MSLLSVLLALAGGCATVQRSVVDDMPGDDQDTQIDFWHTLATKSVCSNNDAFHALLLDIDGTDPNPDYAARVAALKQRGLVLGWFNRPANEGVTRGTVAVAICKAAGIKGGVTMRLFGPNERYCLRELVYMNLLPPSSENQTFSGVELVGVIGRFEDYQRGNPADLPASEMPSPAPSFRGNPQLLKAQANQPS